jgi:hypothetical protein
VRWDELFDDLAGQGAAALADEHAGEVADRGRYEIGRVTLSDRLRAWPVRARLSVGLAGGQRLSGELVAVGLDWLAVVDGGRESVVRLGAIRWLRPVSELGVAPVAAAAASAASLTVAAATTVAAAATVACAESDLGAPAGGAVREHTGLAQARRVLVRDRAVVRAVLLDGDSVCGTLDRAGADHLELAQHPLDEPRRDASVQASWLIPYAALAVVCGGQVWSAS